MKFLKPLALTATLAAAALFAPQADAAIAVSIAAAGSSAVFNAIGDDAVNTAGAHCGTNHWSKKNGGWMHDNRTGLHGTNIVDEQANVWVTWDGLPNGTTATVACLYVAVDSGIGVRGYMANPRADLYIDAANNTGLVNGDSLVGSLASEAAVPLPQVIFTAINGGLNAPYAGTTMNICFSDIRPEDAQYATARALSKVPAAPQSRGGLGYGDWTDPFTFGSTLVGTSIQSSYGGQLATPVDFEIAPLGLDPISGLAPVRWQTFPVGGIPVMIIVSNADNSVTGLGNGLVPAETAVGPWTAGPYLANNVDRFTASYVFDGSLTRTTDVLSNGAAVAANCAQGPGATGANLCGLTVITREPLSGTYNTFEFTVPRTHDVQLSQEDFVNPPAGGVNNALNIVAASGGTRLRVIGTGQMVAAVCGNIAPCNQAARAGFVPTANRIGYAFWSYGNLKNLRGTHGGLTGNQYNSVANGGAPPLGHYLLLDGVDPVFTHSNDNPDGALNPPICGTPPCPVLPFTHVIDGSYGSWSLVQAIVNNNVSVGDGSVFDDLLGGLPASAVKFSDFVPAGQMLAFRSHRDANVAGIGARNGNGCAVGYGNDLGQAMGGAIFLIQNDVNYQFDATGRTNTCVGTSNADDGLTNLVQ